MKGSKRQRKLFVIIAVVVAVALGAIGGVASYVGDYQRADERAQAALRSSEEVQVRTLDDGNIVFEPRDPQAGVVFYPGGKVQPEAYAPLMNALAQRGFVSIIVAMPFNLAVLNVNGADGIQERFPTVERWVLMGHSLGGSIAATYADGHDGQWAGLVLLAAYSTADLSDNDICILSIRGSNDGVLNEQALADNRHNLAFDTPDIVIPGGNHGQFGDYGTQTGDGAATISAEEQQAITADEVARAFLES